MREYRFRTVIHDPVRCRTCGFLSQNSTWLIIGGSHPPDVVIREIVHENGERVVLRGHHQQIRHIAAIPKSSQFLTASDDGTIRLWKK